MVRLNMRRKVQILSKGKCMDTKPCVQKRLLNFAKSNKWWIVVFLIQVGFSFAISFFFMHPSEAYRVSTDLSKLLLSSLIDVFIALFGFVGLILVFIFEILLRAKEQLEKERFEVVSKRREFEVQMALEFEKALILKGSQTTDLVKQVRKNLDDRINEVGNRLTSNKKQIRDALFSGTMAIGTAVTCILMNIWAFGDIINEVEGIHFFDITLLLSLFFLCVDFIFQGIKTVISQK